LTKAVNMESATVGESVFINQGTKIKGQVDMRAHVTGQVAIRNATITATELTEAFDMSSATVCGSVFIVEGTQITGKVDLRAHVTGLVAIRNATITATELTKAVNMSFATVGGSVFINQGTKIKGQVDLRAHVTGQVEIRNATITATESTTAFDMSSATVGGSVFINQGTKIKGQVDLRAKVTGQVAISNATITATELTEAINMDSATVDGSVFIIQGTQITGKVDLRAKVTGQVEISNATIRAKKLTRAVIMNRATVGESVFIVEGTQITGQVDLRAKVTGQVEISNATITATESTTAVNMNSATVGGSVFINQGTKIKGQVDLRAHVTGQVAISNATITATESTTAVNMEFATVGGAVCILNQVRIRGMISLLQATLGCLSVTSTPSQEKFTIPQGETHIMPRTALIHGQLDLSYATIHGPCQIHHLSHFGEFNARHLTVQGDLDLCGSIVGTKTTEVQQKWLDDEFKKPDPSTSWSSVETSDRIMPNENQKTIDLEMAVIHGHCWLKGTRVLGNIYFRDAEIAGDVNIDEGEVHGNLQLPSSIIKGRVFADEKSTATSYPRVKGEIDLSFANVQQVHVNLGNETDAARPKKINLTNATIDTFSLSGKVKINSDFAIITEQSTIQTIQFDEKKPLTVVDTSLMFGFRDKLRSLLFAIFCLLIFSTLVFNFYVFPFLVFLAFATYNFALYWRHHVLLDTKPPAIPILDHLHLTKPFSRGYYVMVEQRLRSKGNDEHADEVFLMRRKREREEQQENNSGGFSLWRNLCDWCSRLCSRIGQWNGSRRWSSLWGWSSRLFSSLGLWSGSRLWSGFLDFIMGYGVRMHRILVIYVLIGFLNWAVFLDKNSVERPIVFVQNRTDGPAWGCAPEEPGRDPNKMENNVWPSDGGRAFGLNEWDAKHAFFLALRLQIPIIQLVTENDWTPATRKMENPPFRWTGISYADFASITMVLNLLLIPLLVTGLTGYNKKL
jgi:NDP-sugar pyrophosphorylase family protein